jgi:hypothetical protein
MVVGPSEAGLDFCEEAAPAAAVRIARPQSRLTNGRVGASFVREGCEAPAVCYPARGFHATTGALLRIAESPELDAGSSGHSLSRCFQVSQDLFGVPIRLHVLEDMLDLALRSDHKGGPGHPPDFLPVHVLLFHDAKGLGHVLVDVSQQGERETLLLLKFLLGFWGIGGDPKQHGARLLNLFI